jgi:hypothetical protein
VVCFLARPHATRGETRAVDRLAAARGWDHVAVVISRYHPRRTGLLLRQCLPHADMDLVAADGGAGAPQGAARGRRAGPGDDDPPGVLSRRRTSRRLRRDRVLADSEAAHPFDAPIAPGEHA